MKGDKLSLFSMLDMKIKLTNFIALTILIYMYHMNLLFVGIYESRRIHSGKGELKDIVKAVIIGTIILVIIVIIFQRENVTRDVLVVFTVLLCIFMCVSRYIIRGILECVRKGSRDLRNILLVGCNKRACDFALHIMKSPQLGYRIVGYIDDLPNGRGFARFGLPLEYLGGLHDLEAAVDASQVDEVVISLPIRSFYEQMNQIIKACETQGIDVHLLSNFFPLQIARSHVADFEGIPVLTLRTGVFPGWSQYAKRIFDFVVASVLVVLFLPILLLTALLIKILSPDGPIFFIQTRVGYSRRRFQMIKFRTMVPNAESRQHALETLNEAQGPVFKLKNDPRITPIGRFLRKTSLDELPQLFNVLKGDMSLVGPRPLPLRDVNRFEESSLKRRFSVKPGITCLWQINGRSNSNFDQWIKYDLEYIDHWSFELDLKILIKTIPVVLRGVGSY
jgi:exopolysaccharide biosynthesis polyprenyl glycosylphosphotransferase